MHIVVLTGAGISAESGIPTFRGAGGLWEGHRIEDVASPEGWARDPALVLEFYNQRRRAIALAHPNRGHFALAELQKEHTVSIITQNIDDLHERAGSRNVMHLHGEIFKARSERDPSLICTCTGDILLSDTASDGAPLRPHIVWFGEMVPMIEHAIQVVKNSDLLLIIGTSMVVYPAASLYHYVPHGTPVFVINPDKPEIPRANGLQFIEMPAGTGVDHFISHHLSAAL